MDPEAQLSQSEVERRSLCKIGPQGQRLKQNGIVRLKIRRILGAPAAPQSEHNPLLRTDGNLARRPFDAAFIGVAEGYRDNRRDGIMGNVYNTWQRRLESGDTAFKAMDVTSEVIDWFFCIKICDLWFQQERSICSTGVVGAQSVSPSE
jgi:hypothetical protein